MLVTIKILHNFTGVMITIWWVTTVTHSPTTWPSSWQAEIYPDTSQTCLKISSTGELKPQLVHEIGYATEGTYSFICIKKSCYYLLHTDCTNVFQCSLFNVRVLWGKINYLFSLRISGLLLKTLSQA